MSKHEDPMLARWCEEHQARMALEYPVDPPGSARRCLDGLARFDLEPACLDKGQWRRLGGTRGSDVAILQAKAHRLSFALLGQAFFSIELARRYLGAASVRSIALCTRDDADVHPIADAHGVQVIEMPWAGPTNPFPLPYAREVIQRACAALGGWLVFDVQLTPAQLPIAYGQRAHAAIFFDGPWQAGDTLDGRDFMLVSQPGKRKNGHGHGLGMYILGQALFSAELVRAVARPARLRTAVAVVKDDRALHELADDYAIEVHLAQ